MRKPSKRKFSNYEAIKIFKKYILPFLAVGIMVLYSSKDHLYFHNGSGGTSWEIGTPKVNLANAHISHSLPEIRAFALELVNRDRLLNGLPPLIENPLLSQAAQFHAEDMMKRNYYAHITPEGKTPTDRFQKIGGTKGVGENIMKQEGAREIRLTYGLIEQYQRGWMYSDGHRQNLLTPEYKQFGYGIVLHSLFGKAYAVQNFTH